MRERERERIWKFLRIVKQNYGESLHILNPITHLTQQQKKKIYIYIYIDEHVVQN